MSRCPPANPSRYFAGARLIDARGERRSGLFLEKSARQQARLGISAQRAQSEDLLCPGNVSHGAAREGLRVPLEQVKRGSRISRGARGVDLTQQGRLGTEARER